MAPLLKSLQLILPSCWTLLPEDFLLNGVQTPQSGIWSSWCSSNHISSLSVRFLTRDLPVSQTAAVPLMDQSSRLCALPTASREVYTLFALHSLKAYHPSKPKLNATSFTSSCYPHLNVISSTSKLPGNAVYNLMALASEHLWHLSYLTYWLACCMFFESRNYDSHLYISNRNCHGILHSVNTVNICKFLQTIYKSSSYLNSGNKAHKICFGLSVYWYLSRQCEHMGL